MKKKIQTECSLNDTYMYLLANKSKKCAKSFMANCKDKSEDEMNMGICGIMGRRGQDSHAKNVMFAFSWQKAKEGDKYWLEVYNWCKERKKI